MTGDLLGQTPHWLIAAGDRDVPVHVVLTPRAGDRADDLSELHIDEREDLLAALAAEVDRRHLGRVGYVVQMNAVPGRQLEVHLMAGGRRDGPCPGVPFTGAESEVGMLMDLAHAVQCPLCGTSVSQWRIGNGVMGHDPGE